MKHEIKVLIETLEKASINDLYDRMIHLLSKVIVRGVPSDVIKIVEYRSLRIKTH
jgi:hypothetical protein